jgi:hypothetical protein
MPEHLASMFSINILAMAEKKPKKVKKNGEPYKTAGPPHFSGPPGWKPTPEQPVKNPRKHIDPVELERLCYLHVPILTMSKYFNMDNDYFTARINSDPELIAAKNRGEARMKIDLAQQQIDIAFDKKDMFHGTMAIFLGKNLLGQSDKPKDEQNTPTRIEFVFPEAKAPRPLELAAEIIEATVEHEESDENTENTTST